MDTSGSRLDFSANLSRWLRHIILTIFTQAGTSRKLCQGRQWESPVSGDAGSIFKRNSQTWNLGKPKSNEHVDYRGMVVLPTLFDWAKYVNIWYVKMKYAICIYLKNSTRRKVCVHPSPEVRRLRKENWKNEQWNSSADSSASYFWYWHVNCSEVRWTWQLHPAGFCSSTVNGDPEAGGRKNTSPKVFHTERRYPLDDWKILLLDPLKPRGFKCNKSMFSETVQRNIYTDLIYHESSLEDP